MATYLFLILPAYGHINSTLAVAEELVQRGERVIYYVTDEFQEAVAATGAIVRSYTAQSVTSIGMMASVFIDETRLVLSQILDSIRADAPDVIVYDSLCLWTIIATRVLRIPAVATRPTYAVNEHFSMFSMSADLSEDRRARMTEMMGKANASIADICAEYDLAPMGITDVFTHSGPLNVVFLSKEFQPAGETFDERHVFVGPSIMRRRLASDFPLEQIDPGRPLLYVSLGTIFNNKPEFFKLCFDAFGETDYQVVLSRGKQVDPAALGPVPDNFLLSGYAPQLEILARSRVFVTHAGMNSTMESLYYGVPMVAIPQMPEQALTARRIVELGLGVALEDAGVSAAALGDAVAGVAADDAILARTRVMQERTRAAGGYQRAADAIVQFAHQHSGG